MKKIILILSILCLSVVRASAQTAILPPILGDMNDDGKLSVVDITLLVNINKGNIPTLFTNLEDFSYIVNNEKVIGTWYSTQDGSSITFNPDSTTDYHNAATYEFYPNKNRILVYDALGYIVHAIFLTEITDQYMDVIDYSTNVTTRYIKSTSWILVSGITLTPSTLNMSPGETSQLTATTIPSDAINTEVTWTSSNENVVTVDTNGLVTAVAGGSCTITATAQDGSGVTATCTVTVSETHEYVDLGLPSGTLWATCNIGAATPEDYGDYFAWGETTTKSNYNLSTYKYCNGSWDTMTKYCNNSSYGYNGFTDTLKELEPEDDAAYVNWGSNWCMPSEEQFLELINSSYTTTTWTTQDGKYGRKITSKTNGNSIFLPTAGYRDVTSLYDASSRGLYWSRTLRTSNPSQARYLDFNSSNIDTGNYGGRCYGQGVRPVRVNQTPSVMVTGISLSQSSLTLNSGTTAQLTATITPTNATNTTVTWSSSNESVATVDASGKVTAVGPGTAVITASATDGSGVSASCTVTVITDKSGSIDGHDYVDLGLPSGTLWATCNIGATSPEGYGGYYAWGETTTKSTYGSINYTYSSTNSELPTSADAAYVRWGANWRIPSSGQFAELINSSYTTTTWTTQNGKYGFKITSKTNGNSIFLPNAGYYSDMPYYTGGYYWSRNKSNNNTSAIYLHFYSDFINYNYSGPRYYGQSVRPVRNSE